MIKEEKRKETRKESGYKNYIAHKNICSADCSVNLSIVKIYDFMNFRFSKEFIWWASSYMLCMCMCVCEHAFKSLLYRIRTNSTLISSTTRIYDNSLMESTLYIFYHHFYRHAYFKSKSNFLYDDFFFSLILDITIFFLSRIQIQIHTQTEWWRKKL